MLAEHGEPLVELAAELADRPRALGDLLFGLTPLDSETFIGVATLFAIVATLAALLKSSGTMGIG